MPIVPYVIVQPTADRGTSNNVDFRPNVDLPDTEMTPADLGLSLSVSWDLYIAGVRTTYTPQPAPSAGLTIEKVVSLIGDANVPAPNVTLPLDITDGNLLIMVPHLGNQGANFTVPTTEGWAAYNDGADAIFNGSFNLSAIITKTASGDSGAVVPLATDGGSNRATAILMEVSGATTGIVDYLRTPNSLDSGALDLGSAAPTIWLAVGATERSIDFTGFPSGWGNNVQATSQPAPVQGSAHSSVAGATLENSAQSADPDAFVGGHTNVDSTLLIGVR